ncbi:hypothetical protein ZIOFF_019826 [Zingiber officinale]|uniref:CN hydrolase domain-containing protein n=2 Tax=Zingiber officinale TaxID=94328 RepID=A0A8J5HA93_ZINOF|nr:hypothetical protein ZIOFF_019826 [Zingiber officinale]
MADARKVVVAALQFACSDTVSENVDTAERLVRAAHKEGANIILIQELFEGYYFCQAQRADYFQRAKPYKGHPTILRMQQLAKELGVVIPVSFFEEENNAHYNSVAIIDADGTDLGLYRKSHIPDGPGRDYCIDGRSSISTQVTLALRSSPPDLRRLVWVSKLLAASRSICWDQWFPEAARAMVLQGAEILLYPTAIGSEPQDQELDSREHWKRVMQGHAGANLVPLAASNRIGKETIRTEHGASTITFYGNSFIAGPTGEIVALASDTNEEILVAEFNLDYIKTLRHSWGVFRDRRPDLYKLKVMALKQVLAFLILFLATGALRYSAFASDPDILVDFIPPPEGTPVDGSYFAFSGLRSVVGGRLPPDNFTVTKASMSNFPALNGQSVSMAVLTYPQGSVNPLHTHPRAAELLLLMQGNLEVGFVDTANKLYTRSLQRGDAFVFPKGLVHFQFNCGKGPAVAVSAFGSANAGTVSVPQSTFGVDIDDGILAASFKTDAATVQKLKAGLRGPK